jgi:hypothetical protein
MRAVGHGGEADTTWIPARAGWVYLLHSDGVTKAMRLDELGEAMALGSAAAACEAVSRKVEERGPDDNYTAVVVRVLPDDGSAELADATLPTPGAAPAAPARRTGRHEETVVARNHDDRDDDVSRPSPLGPLAAALAGLALVVGGYAALTGTQARGTAADARADVAALRTRVDSLAQRLPADTAGRLPVTVDSAAAVAPPAAPPPPPAPAAPASRTPTRP